MILPDIVLLASPFTSDLTDLKGQAWVKNTSNSTYPRVISGYLQMGINQASLQANPAALRLPLYRSWQIRFDVYFGTLGSSGVGGMIFASFGAAGFVWRADNVANRMSVEIYGAGFTYPTRVGSVSISTYTAFNTVILECHDGFYYLYVNSALVGRQSTGPAPISFDTPFVELGNSSSGTNSTFRFNNVRIIQGAAPVTESISDPGFTATAVPRTLFDPASLTAAAQIYGGQSGGIRRTLAARQARALRSVPSVRPLALPDRQALGKITGTVKVGELPVSRPVVLLDRDMMKPLASTVSGSDGAYRFDHIPMDLSYMVVAKDTTATYNAVVADRVTAVNY